MILMSGSFAEAWKFKVLFYFKRRTFIDQSWSSWCFL